MPGARRKIAAGAAIALLATPAGAAATRAPGRVVLELPDAPAIHAGVRAFAPVSAVAALRDGRIVIAGQRAHGDLFIAELTAAGELDEVFGVGGFALPSLPGRVRPLQVLAQPDGRVLVVGAAGHGELVLVRLTPGGKGDVTFGRGGAVVLSGVRAGCGRCQPAGLTPDGAIVVAADTPQGGLVVVRLKAAGTLDAAFGSQGAASVSPGALAQALAVQPDGAILVGGVRPGAGSILARLTPAGAADAAFATVQLPGQSLGRLLAQPDGGVVVLAGQGPRAMVARYTPAGAPDPGFGDRGVVRLGDAIGPAAVMLPASGGAVLVIGGRPGAVVIARIDAQGRPDPAFGGASGNTLGLPFGGGDVRGRRGGRLLQDSFDPAASGAITQRADGSLVLAGEVHVAAAAPARFISRAAIAALTPGFALDPSFGGDEPLRVSARLEPRPAGDALVLRVAASEAGLAAVTARHGGRTVARATVPLLVAAPQLVSVPLTAYGRRVLARHRRLRLRVRLLARDLAANQAAATARGVITERLRARSRAAHGRRP